MFVSGFLVGRGVNVIEFGVEVSKFDDCVCCLAAGLRVNFCCRCFGLVF